MFASGPPMLAHGNGGVSAAPVPPSPFANGHLISPPMRLPPAQMQMPASHPLHRRLRWGTHVWRPPLPPQHLNGGPCSMPLMSMQP